MTPMTPTETPELPIVIDRDVWVDDVYDREILASYLAGMTPEELIHRIGPQRAARVLRRVQHSTSPIGPKKDSPR